MKYCFSNFAEASLIPSAINQLTAEFAEDFREGTDINLGVGYVNDKTIPVNAINTAYLDVVAKPECYRNALNYGGAEGSPNLRRSVKEYYLKYNIGQLTADDFEKYRILIGANGATSILDSISDILKPGLVITADPYYYIYTESLERKGFTILTIPEDSQGLRVEILQDELLNVDPSDISFFYIITVNNPSTVVLSDHRREAIVRIAQNLSKSSGNLIPVVFDKAYEDIIHKPRKTQPVSGLKFDELHQVIEVGTLSKILAPALRIGYAICHDSAIANALCQRTSDIGFSAPLINQEVASWLLDNYIHKQKEIVNQGYQNKAAFIKQLFSEHLSEYIESATGGEASFYYYLTLNNICTYKNSDFFNFLSRITGDKQIDGELVKKPRLVYIPGTICSKSDKAKYQLRLSYGFENTDEFKRAVLLIADACRYASGK